MIVTIDGPAAAGKGTLSRTLALKYCLSAFDTGMIYRALGVKMINMGLDVNCEDQAKKVAEELSFQEMMQLSSDAKFRTDIGSQAASIVSAHPKVREALLKMQQDFSKNPVFEDGSKADGVVYDGRDTGTVVCPNADVKFFITATPEVRAKRRFEEFLKKGIKTTFENVLSDMIKRDERDSNRKSAPLKPADDAHILDTSVLSIEEVVKAACNIIDLKGV